MTTTLEQIFSTSYNYLREYINKIYPDTVNNYNINDSRYIVADYLIKNNTIVPNEYTSSPNFKEFMIYAESYQQFINLFKNGDIIYTNLNISEGLNLIGYKRIIQEEDDSVLVEIEFTYKSDVKLDYRMQFYAENLEVFKDDYSQYVTKIFNSSSGTFSIEAQNVNESSQSTVEILEAELPIEKCRNALIKLDELLQKSF